MADVRSNSTGILPPLILPYHHPKLHEWMISLFQSELRPVSASENAVVSAIPVSRSTVDFFALRKDFPV